MNGEPLYNKGNTEGSSSYYCEKKAPLFWWTAVLIGLLSCYALFDANSTLHLFNALHQ